MEMERETAASSVLSAWVKIRIILTYTPPPKSSYLHACVFMPIKPNLYITKKIFYECLSDWLSFGFCWRPSKRYMAPLSSMCDLIWFYDMQIKFIHTVIACGYWISGTVLHKIPVFGSKSVFAHAQDQKVIS